MNKEGYEIRARSGYFAPTVGEMERGRAEAAAAEVPADIERALGELSLDERSDHADRLLDRHDPRRSRTDAGQHRVGSQGVCIEWRGDRTRDPGRLTGRDQLFLDRPHDVAASVVRRTRWRAGSQDEGTQCAGATKSRATATDHVPAFDGSKLAIGSPMILRTRTAREARAMAAGDDGASRGAPRIRSIRSAVHSFPRLRRTGRRGRGAAAQQSRQRTSVTVRRLLREGIYQLDLPLSVSVRDDYVIAIDATRGTESARALVPFRVR